jgi:peptidoglycan hydrolase-like protein with peptidoglycan-binding domain
LGNSCGIILTSYLRQHQQNPVDQVKVLQAFLNNELGLAIPVTGYFGPLTESAVNQFQLKYHGDVLLPWVPYGLPNEMTPTGYVYKTTQWKINMIACPDLNLPVPQLP